MVLFRAVDIGAELFAIAATCVRARAEAKRGHKSALLLADVFCREAEMRVDALFDNLFGRTDSSVYKLSQQVLEGEHAWLEAGIVGLGAGNLEKLETAVEEEELVGNR
jgi:hypothetical protein